MNPLRGGPRAISNIDRAGSDEHVRGGISSMQSNQFGRGRVPMQQSRIDPGTFRQASLMTGANPVSPSRRKLPLDRPASQLQLDSESSKRQPAFFQQQRAAKYIGSEWKRRRKFQPWRRPDSECSRRRSRADVQAISITESGPARFHCAFDATGAVDSIVQTRLAHFYSAIGPRTAIERRQGIWRTGR